MHGWIDGQLDGYVSMVLQVWDFEGVAHVLHCRGL